VKVATYTHSIGSAGLPSHGSTLVGKTLNRLLAITGTYGRGEFNGKGSWPMASRLIRTADDLDALWLLFSSLKPPFSVEWTQGVDRTAQQNKLMWLWASEVEQQTQQETSDEVQRRWKLDHGIPILCESSESYRSFCRLTLKHLPYEKRKEAMKFVPVTSEMNVRQMVRFLDTVERECLENGIVLTQPDPDLAAYHSRYRLKDAA
jgi:hypothetical protein